MNTTPFALFLRRDLPSRQTLILTLIAMLPAWILLIMRFLGKGLQFFEGGGAALMLQGPALIVPIFFAVAAFHEDFEQRTIVYLLTRPPSRNTYVLSKFFASWFCSFATVGIAVVAMAAISMWGRFDYFEYYLKLTGALLLTTGLATGVYTGLFLIFGLWLKNPVIWGLVFSAAWEWALGLVPAKMIAYTIGFYSKCLFISLTDAEPREFFTRVIETPSMVPGIPGKVVNVADDLPLVSAGYAATVMAVAIVASVAFAAYLFRNREDA
jgi:ABC-type transport system involved in multi-copper enzyme maturation permease subunit